MQRVAVYIDGFNLYYGLRSKGWRRYYWLNPHRLAEKLLRPGQELAIVRYFTAPLSPSIGLGGRSKRQRIYLEALATLPNLHTHFGYYITKERRCHQCRATWEDPEEKMTDVNIAVEMLGDAQDDAFDRAIIISGDGDLVGPVTAINHRYPEKRVIVAFPPERSSFGLGKVASTSFTIGRKVLSDSQMPDEVVKPDGYVLSRPPSWS